MNIFSKLFSKGNNPKIKRELPLEHVYTCNDGQRLYTYKGEYFKDISSRYYLAVQESYNYLLKYNESKQEVIARFAAMEQSALQVISNSNKPAIVASAGSDLLQMIKEMRALSDGSIKVNQTILQSMFCMFYLFEDEKECGYNEAFNAKKLALLETMNPDDRDFFFTTLKKGLKL